MAEDRQVRYDPAEDYYRLFNLPSTATAEDIQRVFRQRAKELHPDMNPNRREWATEQFKRLNEVYEALGDPALRADYDQQRYVYLSQAFNAPWTSPPLSGAKRAGQPRWRMSRRVYMTLWALGMAASLLAHVLTPQQSGSLYNDPLRPYPTFDVVSLLLTSTPYKQVPCTDPEVQITHPTAGASVVSPVDVTGTATGQDFASYDLDLGMIIPGTSMIDWGPLVQKGTQPVKDGLLVAKGSSPRVARGLTYILRLSVSSKSGAVRQCSVEFQAE